MFSLNKWNKKILLVLAFMCLLFYEYIQQPSFANRTWLLTSIIENGERKEITQRIFLRFYNLFNVAIDADCASATYSYKIRLKNRLVLYNGPGFRVSKWCPESEILGSFISFGGSYTVNGNQLRIYLSPGEFLVFTEINL